MKPNEVNFGGCHGKLMENQRIQLLFRLYRDEMYTKLDQSGIEFVAE
jgi:hypothetical protein